MWQGGIYTLEEFRTVCGYGEPSNPDHIYSYNCRHTHYPYWPGISEPLTFPPEPGPFEVDGKTYTYYQATQKQRAMERSIRAAKRDALAQDAMGDKSALAAAKIRLDEKTAAYKRFSAQVNMRPRLERTTVLGYDRGAAVSARSAVTNVLEQFGVPEGGMLRRAGNRGVFAVLSERMTKKHIREVAKEYGISLKRLSLVVDSDPEKISDRCWFTGVADPNNIGTIIFCPKAFASKEMLVRTLFHEKVHVLQFLEHGSEYVQNNRAYFEQLAYEAENAFILQMKQEGRL